jgi:beta-lactam-binding protein with PASTA domain
MNISNFFKKHIIIANLLLAIIILVVLTTILMFWLDSYTNHGKAVEVPDVKGLKPEVAAAIFQERELSYAVIDSQFIKNALPGTILETIPPTGTSVKKGRTIYLTVNSFSAQLLVIPDVIDISQRQASSMLKSIGFESIQEKLVPGAYRDLVVGLETRGKTLSIGDKVPANAPLTLLISSGVEEITPNEVEEEDLEMIEEESWF